jgi:hypothetical protein
MSDLPRSIAIGPLVYAVKDDEASHAREVWKSSKHGWGAINYGPGEIILDPEQNDQHKRAALLHEVLHGCWHITDPQVEYEEAAIRILTLPLLDVLRRNRALVEYLTAEDAPPSAASADPTVDAAADTTETSEGAGAPLAIDEAAFFRP